MRKKDLIVEFQELHKSLYGFEHKYAHSMTKEGLQSGIMNLSEHLDSVIKMSYFEDDDFEEGIHNEVYGL